MGLVSQPLGIASSSVVFVTLDLSCPSLDLSFFFCKMGMVMAHTS